MCLVARSFFNKHCPGASLSVSYPSRPWERRGAQVQCGDKEEVVAIGCEGCLGAPTQGSRTERIPSRWESSLPRPAGESC